MISQNITLSASQLLYQAARVATADQIEIALDAIEHARRILERLEDELKERANR